MLILAGWLPAHAVQANYSFEECMSKIGSQAKMEGISDKTVQYVLGKVKNIPRIINTS